MDVSTDRLPAISNASAASENGNLRDSTATRGRVVRKRLPRSDDLAADSTIEEPIEDSEHKLNDLA
jgi:hypothetical protein